MKKILFALFICSSIYSKAQIIRTDSVNDQSYMTISPIKVGFLENNVFADRLYIDVTKYRAKTINKVGYAYFNFWIGYPESTTGRYMPLYSGSTSTLIRFDTISLGMADVSLWFNVQDSISTLNIEITGN